MDFLSYWVYLTLLLHWKSPQHHVGIIRVGIITNITSSGTQLAIIISVNADIKHLPVHYDASLNQPTVHPCQVQPHHGQVREVQLWMQPQGCEEEDMRSGRVPPPRARREQTAPTSHDGGGGNDLPYVVLLKLLAPIPV